MDANSILFQFVDRKSAFNAFDTLNELGYQPVFHPESNQPQLHIHLENDDLTSALEIAQAFGGTFVEQQKSEESPQITEQKAIEMCYFPNEHEISIPAHIINEDWTEGYAENHSENHALPEVPIQSEFYDLNES